MPLVKVHCQYKDDDLGVRTLKSGDQFDFPFSMNFFGTTLYHCSFLWGSKHNHFEVFKWRKSYCGGKLFRNVYCTWLMKDCGIYLALVPNPSPNEFKFLKPWL
ncbi:putative WAT1-related protein-like [Capsicum annuum]|nr:putative WAT1-related protein-like [Capsicum annuum]